MLVEHPITSLNSVRSTRKKDTAQKNWGCNDNAVWAIQAVKSWSSELCALQTSQSAKVQTGEGLICRSSKRNKVDRCQRVMLVLRVLRDEPPPTQSMKSTQYPCDRSNAGPLEKKVHQIRSVLESFEEWPEPGPSRMKLGKIYRIKHFLSFFRLVRRAARVAVSKTSRTPMLVFAEHSRYLYAPIFLQTSSPWTNK